MGLVVELCGLPGSGKSTVAAHACAALRGAGTEAVVADLPVSAAAPASARLRRKIWAATSAAVADPVATARAARMVSSSRPTPRDGLGLLVQWLTVQQLERSARARPGVWLLEEGSVQTGWSLALRASPQWPGPERVLQGQPPDLLVVVAAPLEVLLGRLEGRPSQHSRTQRLVADRRGAELERGRLLLDRLVGAMPCDRFTVLNDGSVPAEELGRLAAEWVLRAA